MAAAAPITGAPTRAPAIIPFPDTPMARARRELNLCWSHRMLSDWARRVKSCRDLSPDELLDLACRSSRAHVAISLREAR